MLFKRGVDMHLIPSSFTASNSFGTEEVIEMESWLGVAGPAAGESSLILPIDLAFGSGPAMV